MERFKLFATLVVTGFIAGCSTPDVGSPAYNHQMMEKKYEMQKERVKDTINEVPDWYTDIPKEDEYSLYAAGHAVSSDLQFAVDKSILAAKRNLADQVNGKISSQLKEFMNEAGIQNDTQAIIESQRVTKNVIAEIALSGYRVLQKKIVPSGTQFTCYTEIQYPIGETNKLLVAKLKQDQILDTKIKASKAFQELESEIEAAKPVKE